MAKAEFDSYGNTKKEHVKFEAAIKIPQFNDVNGGGSKVDPYGQTEKKDSSKINMNAGEAFNKKDLTKVDAMGTDYAKKNRSQVEEKAQGGSHFNTKEISAFGDDAGKSKSGQSRR